MRTATQYLSDSDSKILVQTHFRAIKYDHGPIEHEHRMGLFYALDNP